MPHTVDRGVEIDRRCTVTDAPVTRIAVARISTRISTRISDIASRSPGSGSSRAPIANDPDLQIIA
ncbi:MAG TPA: hypothetical protein VK601_05475, partial [Kofleriaceae bacterium]|nr:hypothetical protein [Kofleriaceae bacterium]